MRKKSRLRLVVYPRFQLRLLVIQALILIATFVFVFVQYVRSMAFMKSLGARAGIPSGDPYFQFLDFQMRYVGHQLAIAFGLALLVGTFIMLLLSHRLAGPILRLRSYFLEIARTSAVEQKLSFRKGDYFPDLPPAINAALAQLQKGHSKRKAS